TPPPAPKAEPAPAPPAPAPEVVAAPVQEPPPVAAVEAPPPAKVQPPVVKATAVKPVREVAAPRQSSREAAEKQILDLVRQVERSALFADDTNKGMTRQTALNYLNKRLQLIRDGADTQERLEILSEIQGWKHQYLK
ncbi:serine/threonine protein kinase, partial [Corallococcus sp. 4LFB]